MSAILIAFSLLLASGCSFVTQNGNRYALVYGVGDYLNVSDLPGATQDGVDMQQLLTSQDYEVINLGSGTGSLARAEFEADLQAAAVTLTTKDTLLFYYAGHGALIPGTSEGYLAFSDAGTEYDPTIDLAHSKLLDMLAEIPALHRTVIIDACNASSALTEGYGVDSLPPEAIHPVNLDEDGKGEGIIAAVRNWLDLNNTRKDFSVMTASGWAEESYEWGGTATETVPAEFADNGVFTGFLLEASVDGDKNGDGLVTLTEAYGHVFRRIDSTWNDYWRSQSASYWYAIFYPHISGNALDPVLFRVE